MKKQYKLIWLAMLLLLVLSACTPPVPTEAPELSELTVMTHDSFSVSEDVIAQFEQENQVKVVFLKSGDTGSVLNRAILSKNAPLADVLYGVDNTFLSRALEADIFEAYQSPTLSKVASEFKLDAENRVTPVDYGDVCINYDKAFFAEKGLALPQTLDDLLKPEYKGLLVVENPATSSPGLAFMLATVAEYGEEGFLNYWVALRENEVAVVNDWDTAYYTNFSASTGKGQQPMVVSYGSSPPVEVVYASEPLEDAPTASLVGKNMCFRQIEFVGVLKGAKNPDMAQKFIDFMLSKPFQEDMPLQMFVYPVNPDAQLPDVFIQYAQIPESPARVDPQSIADNREKWIDAWNEMVLK